MDKKVKTNTNKVVEVPIGEAVRELFNVNKGEEYEIQIKGYFLEKIFYNIPLTYYDKGNIMFFKEEDAELGDKILITTYAEGDSTSHSERMGIDIEKHFKMDEYTLISKSSIKYFEISQNICPNPDCTSCEKDGMPSALLNIFTEARPIPIQFESQSDAFDAMLLLNTWKAGKLKEYIDKIDKEEKQAKHN